MIKYAELKEAIDALPPTAQKELIEFIGYLQYKYRIEQSDQVVQLGGLWAAIDFDVTDEDVRAFRQQTTRHLADNL